MDGFVDLDIKFTDANVPVSGVAVDRIVGQVYNSFGTLVAEDIVPDPILDDGTLYYLKSQFDVRDASKYGGRPFLEVVWQAVKAGVALPDIRKRYWFNPSAPSFADKTFIHWDVPTDGLDSPIAFYNVYRSRTLTAEETEEVFIGKSVSTFFLDDEEWESEFEARAWTYYAKAVYRDRVLPLNDDGSDYLEHDVTLPATIFRTGTSYCILEGRVVDILGRSARYTSERGYDTYVTFRHHEKDRFQFDGNTLILPEMIYSTLMDDGSFSVPLIVGEVVEMEVPASSFRARFLVPNQERVGLGDLDLTIIRDA